MSQFSHKLHGLVKFSGHKKICHNGGNGKVFGHQRTAIYSILFVLPATCSFTLIYSCQCFPPDDKQETVSVDHH